MASNHTAVFPLAGAQALLDVDGTQMAVQILSRNRDGSATIQIVGLTGEDANRIVPLDQLGDPTPLDENESGKLVYLSKLQSQKKALSNGDQARLAALQARRANAQLLPQLLKVQKPAKAPKAAKPAKLKGHRPEQLQLLRQAGAVSRETAVATITDRAFRNGTLSAMVGEGLVQNAYLPFNGDQKRRLSHYWLTEAGAMAAAESVK